jgi:hypothetical protein
MNQSNNTQKNLKPKNQKKYTEAVNLGKKLSKTPDITKVSVATQMFELIHDEDREIISKAPPHGSHVVASRR